MIDDWAPQTWCMFHTLIEKIKENEIDNIKHDLWIQFYNICTNLPCPTCTQHAIKYFSKLKKIKVIDKQHLRTIFFEFHNDVNDRLNKPLFQETDIISTYSKYNTYQVATTFVNRYNIAANKNNAFYQSLQSRQVLSQFIKWYNENSNSFYH